MNVLRLSVFLLSLQVQLMDAKRQLETQVSQLQKTRELLSAAQLDVSTLRLQQSSGEGHRLSLGSPATPTMGFRGQHSAHTVLLHNYTRLSGL